MKNLEIERKFLVKDDSWRDGEPGVLYAQGYLKTFPYVVRVRIEGESSAFLTIKEPLEDGARCEFEYAMPLDEAAYILNNLCEKKPIRKYRYTRKYEGLEWTIDEFLDENQGLVVAELELTRSDQVFAKPGWAGKDVSEDSRYLNSSLIDCPFSRWSS